FAHFGDPRALSKALPYLLLAVTIGALAVAAARWGKLAGAWTAAALALSSGVFLDRLGGGLPRAFGFPIIALGAAALAHGRLRACAVIVACGAAFYAAPALALGMAL